MANYDEKTGIHYGAISQHTPEGFIWDDFESVYETECPECSTVSRDTTKCPKCDFYLGDVEYMGDPSYWEYTGSKEYALEYADTLNAFFVLKSPFYTYSALCSPCAPNAGDLDSPRDVSRGGVKTYCLGHDFFDQGAPYPVFSVETDKPVLSQYYTYHIDLDERGYFRAHVQNSNDDIVISWNLPTWHCVECGNDGNKCTCDDNEIDPTNRLVEDWDIFSDDMGYVKHEEDIDGLGAYLRDMGILPKDAELIRGEDS